ncbi:MAG: hypothetical protein DI533_21705 [Cereibacter sphaeroides]|uniref:Uncharacterized protein n=1 Tax=Cereibacter sphaeroides TaxID=1063 RepID=A0A2W5U9R5_CERSP|nr:MAG: hypothetical protein DI533_21705 [Cereibacter sphaeroides]
MTLVLLEEPNATRPEPRSLHPIAALIERAAIDEHDRDIATSGLCGTFALALLQVLEASAIRAEPVVAFIGKPSSSWRHIKWRHALVSADGRLFDVDGEVEEAHVLENYCWGRATEACGFRRLPMKEFRTLITETRNAFDRRWLAFWLETLSKAAGGPHGL